MIYNLIVYLDNCFYKDEDWLVLTNYNNIHQHLQTSQMAEPLNGVLT